MQTTTTLTQRDRVDHNHKLAMITAGNVLRGITWQVSPFAQDGLVTPVTLTRESSNEPWLLSNSMAVRAFMAARETQYQEAVGARIGQQAMDHLQWISDTANTPIGAWKVGTFVDGSRRLAAPVHTTMSADWRIMDGGPELQNLMLAANMAIASVSACYVDEEEDRLRGIREAHALMVRASDIATQMVGDQVPRWASLNPGFIPVMPDWWIGLAKTQSHMPLRAALVSRSYADTAARNALKLLPAYLPAEQLNGCLLPIYA